MNILSVNRRTRFETLTYKNQTVQSGINKLPVVGPVQITVAGLADDAIADKKHHGGEFKAVYSYAAEDYDYWRQEMARPDIPYGAMGENLTTQGLDEKSVHIGDQFKVGEAVIQAVEPRQPCRVLGMNFQDPTLVKRFLAAGKMGIYYKVIQPGLVKAGDPITPVTTDPEQVPLSEITRLYIKDKEDIPGLERVLRARALNPLWRETFEEQLASARQKASAS